MPTAAETAEKFDALEAQAQRLLAAFTGAGFEYVAPAIIQPAGVLLDVVGEDLRARAYVFNDADGNELCLRPDLTVPTCRLYLERHADANTPARYCYNGPAFRYRPLDAPKGNPREFRQAGIESYAAPDQTAADVEIVALTAKAISEAQSAPLKLRIGDVAILSALLDAIPMPDRWRRRLRHQFWRADAFRAELKRMTSAPAEAARHLPPALAQKLDPADPKAAEVIVADYMDTNGVELFGTRTLTEITAGLLATIADARAKPLTADDANLIESYASVTAPANRAVERLASVLRRPGIDVSAALSNFDQRLTLLKDAGISLADAEFSGDFGRKFEYYTGFVFELETPSLGKSNPIAGGGRYDTLLEIIGAPHRVPAVGAAIYTERLLSIETGAAA